METKEMGRIVSNNSPRLKRGRIQWFFSHNTPWKPEEIWRLSATGTNRMMCHLSCLIKHRTSIKPLSYLMNLQLKNGVAGAVSNKALDLNQSTTTKQGFRKTFFCLKRENFQRHSWIYKILMPIRLRLLLKEIIL